MKVELKRIKRKFGDYGESFFVFINDVAIQSFEDKDSALKTAISFMSDTLRGWCNDYAEKVRYKRLLTFEEKYEVVENLGTVEDILFDRWKNDQGATSLDDATMKEIFDAMDYEDKFYLWPDAE